MRSGHQHKSEEDHSAVRDDVVPEKRAGLARLIWAGVYSLAGLKHALRHETAFRQEAILACVAIPASLLLPVGPLMKLLLVLAMLTVLSVELLNSAVESLADLASPDFHTLVRQAKDMGSAAVLLSLIGLAATWATALAQLFL